MAAADPPSPTGMGFFGMLSFRRSATAVASFDPAQEDELLALHALHAHVADRLEALSSHAQPQGPVLSLPFLSKLLDAVLSSSDAFRAVLALAPVAAAVSRPPADRLAADLLDRSIKMLDVLNAASLTLASLRGAHRAALTAASCLLAPALHRAHFARARRAIARIFPDDAKAGATAPSPSSRTMRALSVSVSKNWSAGRHMNAMAAHLAPPPQVPAAAAAGAGCGLGLALYTMSSVLVFAMWALVAAVPCQDRASAAISPPVAPPKQAQWAVPMSSLQDRIAEEWRRREKKGSSSGSAATAGLLAEMQAVERAARDLNSLLEEIAEEEEDEQAAVAIVSEERTREVTEQAEELAAACRALEDGLAPLERQVRAVFHRVVACRAEVVRCMEHVPRTASSNAAASASGVPPPQHHSF
ncbi:protein ROH1A-like [Phragmites australis]|uniref:protein ROH1A-like n=1 Tax=Phragmites australis TaxID=29695 RepID=UPI002D781353|nr:protein ROH1A-like [Phragmites australis]